ncbi:MAG: transglycosylase domain-containing protein [Bacteroidales bacterium]|jgi:penicillin-binding protein 1A|nr:transglycosylase domain-containing protein [Bacteroidales bacterium]MEE1113340.1 transglycosylase domain-containing protein [Bacteroidales bacterium]MEE1226888.1 transglycosylase domain-containing protein [Bacteroidales bacterium]
MGETTKKKTKTNNFKKYIKVMWGTYFCFLLAVVVFFILLSLGVLGFMPTFEQLENPKANLATEVYSDSGELIGYIGIQNRSNVTYKDISPNLINALVATEDVRFYEHSGIDLRSLFRVLTKTVLGGDKSSGGGSTLTQQLAKNLFPREQKSKLGTVFAKLKEWVVAVKLERNYSKEEILSMYLNTVDYGSNAYGIKAASHIFFSKKPSELEVEEAAVLVGLLKAPTAYSPVRNPENANRRRNVVLGQMQKYNYISEQECKEKSANPIKLRFNPQSHDEGIATYFREMLRNYMKEWCKTHYKANGENYDVHKDGLKIYTTINYKMQKYAEEAVKEHFTSLQSEFFKHTKGYKDAPFTGISKEDIEKYYIQAMKNSDRYRSLKSEGLSEKDIKANFKEKTNMRVFTWAGDKDTIMSPWDSLRYYKHFLNTGMVSIEPQTGHVKVYVGGINYKHFKFDNAKLGRRQVGSTFKPFVYAAAMRDSELSPCYEMENSPVTFEDFDNWTPKNSNDSREGENVTLKWALANSVNFISAALIKDYTTPQAVVDLVKQMGITTPMEAYPSICLGTSDLSVMEMAGAMSTFVNKGIHKEPIFITKICDNKGMVLEVFNSKSNSALDEETSFLVLELMKGVVDGGTGGRLRFRYGLTSTIAGKTGTTDNNSDGWFIGLNPKLATAVWVGGELRSIHFRSTALGQGASMALPVYGLFMKRCEKDSKLNFYKGDFDRPPTISIDMDCSNYVQEIEQGTMEQERNKEW